MSFLELMDGQAAAFKSWVLDGYEAPGVFTVAGATDVDVTGRSPGDALVLAADGVTYEHVAAIPGSSAMVVVVHGTNAAVARPTGVGAVYWQGSVEPDNWQSPDLWNDTSEAP